MDYSNQKFFVMGMSKSGEASARFLLARGAQTYIYDDVITEGTKAVISRLKELGAQEVTEQTLQEAANLCDVLVLSPGIPIDHALPVSFRKKGKTIVGEEELAAPYLRATAVAVTGTNGKTTTVSLIDGVLKQDQKKSVLCGNIGNPLCREVEALTFDDYAVLEISSFQLETLSSLRPHIAVILNITEDHLNRHYTMENYVYLKSRLLKNLRACEYAVLNYDDERVRALAEGTKGKVVWFSAKAQVSGAYVWQGDIYYLGERVLALQEIPIKGLHNVYNVLATVAVGRLLGVNGATIAQAVSTFKGVRHRIERVGNINSVTYIDDSKATNIDATLKAVESMTEPTVLLLGGKNKGYDYVPLFTALKKSQVIHAVFYGENRFQLMEAAVKVGFVAFSLCAEFAPAVRLCAFIAQKGQTVLLSPASSSFDLFANYEERGDAFVQIVGELSHTFAKPNTTDEKEE